MAAPLLIPLLLMGGAVAALFAATSKRNRSEPGGGSGGGSSRTYTLDANMPPEVRDQVLSALATERDPARLEAFAAALAGPYPLSATALRAKAHALRGGGAMPQVFPQPAPVIPTIIPPLPGPFPSPPVMPMPAPVPGPLPGPLPPIPGPPVMPMPAPVPGPLPGPLPPTPGPPVMPMPAPVPGPLPGPLPPIPGPPVMPAPTPYLGGLDPGMPPEVQRAVVGALTTESDPAKLEGFASAIQAQYPVAAGLLMAKAQALRLQRPQPQPHPQPSPSPQPQPSPVPPVNPVGPYPLPSPAPSRFPVGDDTTRTGRNAGRPHGYPFVHIRPIDATYPAKIAKEATGAEGNFVQMTPLNPHVAPNGKWVTLIAGDCLNIPWAWADKLAGRYRIEVDPGAAPSPPVQPSVPGYPGLPTIPGLSELPQPPVGPLPVPVGPVPVGPVPMPAVGGTYTVEPGDFPIKIAKKLTGDGNRWKELVEANPQKKRGADGNFATLLPGELLRLPPSWTGASPAVMAKNAGGSHAAHA